jgi:hypothetical protein
MMFRPFAQRVCGLRDLSPLMAAIMDASCGIVPRTIDNATAVRHFGCELDDLPRAPKRTVVVRAGGRGGKSSRLLAPKALHAAWTVPLPTLQRGEVASSLIVAPDTKLARQTLSFVVGYVEGSAVLRRALIEDPTKDAVELRRPDGKRVRVEVIAASRGGRGARARTLCFAGLDEAAFFYDDATGVVNDADIYRAVLQRIVPGGQCWIVSTPWLADIGLLEQTIAKNWAQHTHALVCTAGTRALNPTWDPTGEIEQDLREVDPDAAVREIDGEPMAGGAGTFFDPAAIRQCVDETIRLPMPLTIGTRAHFGADLGFASDSSALIGVTKQRNGVSLVLSVDELRPRKGAPLRPKAVIDAFATTIDLFAASEFVSDGHYKESAREHLEPHGIRFVDAPGGREGKAETYLLVRKLLHEGRVRLPNHPRLLAQLRSIISRPVPGGGIAIETPRRFGAHGDLVSALVLALWRANRGGASAMQGRGAVGTFDAYAQASVGGANGEHWERRIDGTVPSRPIELDGQALSAQLAPLAAERMRTH